MRHSLHCLALAFLLVVTTALVGIAGPGPRQPEVPAPVLRDRQGDPLPARAIARLGTTRLRHPYPPTEAAFSPDGRILATTSVYTHNIVWLWEVATGRLLRRIASDLPTAHSFQFTPDGEAVVRNIGGKFGLWDARTGKEIRKLPIPEPREILAFALSPDGTLLATHHRMRPVRVWDVTSGKQVGQLPREGEWDPEVVWVPRSRTLVIIARDPQHRLMLRFWDAATRSTRRLTPTPALTAPHPSACVAFAPDGKTMVAVGVESDLRVFDVARGKERLPSRGRVPPVQALRFSPDGRMLAMTGQDNTVWLWDYRGGTDIRRLPSSTARYALAFSPDSKTLATAGKGHEVRLWEIATGKERLPCPGPYFSSMPLAFSADGRKLLALEEGLRFWEVASGTEWQPAFRGVEQHAAVLSHDDKTLAVGCRDQCVELWDVERKKRLADFPPVRARGFPAGETVSGPQSLALSADGSTLAVSNGYKAVTVYDLKALKPLWSFAAEDRGIMVPLALSPDGRALAIRGKGARVAVWDVPTRKLRFRLEHGKYVIRLAYSPDGKTLATVNDEGSVRLWDAASGKVRRDLPGRLPWPEAMAFAPDSSLLAVVGQGGFVLWDVATGARRELVREHVSGLSGVVFSPDGRRIATGNLDGTILVWDVTRYRSQIGSR